MLELVIVSTILRRTGLPCLANVIAGSVALSVGAQGDLPAITVNCSTGDR
jgi:ABC-type thiamin/hydroxymethylpyrimidine transport system permease subunit